MKGQLFPVGRLKMKRQNIVLSNFSWKCNSKFSSLCMSTINQENATSVDFGVTNFGK